MEPVRSSVERVVAFLPNLVLMLVVLLVGLLLSWIFVALVRYALRLADFDRFGERSGIREMLTRGGIQQSPSELVGRVLFWILAVVVFFMAVSALELRATTDLVVDFFNYLPNLLAALVILVFTYLLSRFLYRSTLIGAVNAQIRNAGLLARSVQAAVIVFGLAVILEHLAIGRRVVLAAFSITFGGIVLALALAFGLAGRELAREFLERRLRPKPEAEEERDEIQHL